MISQEPIVINLTPEQEKELEDIIGGFPGMLLRGGRVISVVPSDEDISELREHINIDELQSFSAELGGYWTPTEEEAEEVLHLLRKAHYMEDCTQ